MAALHPARLFHVGMVAADFDAARDRLSRVLGVHWKGGRPAEMQLCIAGETRMVEMRIAHTIEGPPHVELIRAVPDTPWAEAGEGVHHVCYWSDDAAGACEALEDAGHIRLLGEPGSAGGYFRSPEGALIEIIGPAMRDHLAGWLARPAREQEISA